MSLVVGVTLSVIEEHLAVLFCITAQPDRNKHRFEDLLNHGRAFARLIMKPMYETYGTYHPPRGVNHDSDDGGYSYQAFGRDDVAQLEQEIIGHVNLHRTTILAEVGQSPSGARCARRSSDLACALDFGAVVAAAEEDDEGVVFTATCPCKAETTVPFCN